MEVLLLDAVVQSDDVGVLQFPADPGLPFQFLEICMRIILLQSCSFILTTTLISPTLPSDELSSHPYRVTLTFWCL